MLWRIEHVARLNRTTKSLKTVGQRMSTDWLEPKLLIQVVGQAVAPKIGNNLLVVTVKWQSDARPKVSQRLRYVHSFDKEKAPCGARRSCGLCGAETRHEAEGATTKESLLRP